MVRTPGQRHGRHREVGSKGRSRQRPDPLANRRARPRPAPSRVVWRSFEASATIAIECNHPAVTVPGDDRTTRGGRRRRPCRAPSEAPARAVRRARAATVSGWTGGGGRSWCAPSGPPRSGAYPSSSLPASMSHGSTSRTARRRTVRLPLQPSVPPPPRRTARSPCLRTLPDPRSGSGCWPAARCSSRPGARSCCGAARRDPVTQPARMSRTGGWPRTSGSSV